MPLLWSKEAVKTSKKGSLRNLHEKNSKIINDFTEKNTYFLYLPVFCYKSSIMMLNFLKTDSNQNR